MQDICFALLHNLPLLLYRFSSKEFFFDLREVSAGESAFFAAVLLALAVHVDLTIKEYPGAAVARHSRATSAEESGKAVHLDRTRAHLASRKFV